MLNRKLDGQLSQEVITTGNTDVEAVANRRKEDYKNAKYFNKHWYYTSQSAIIVLAGITPLLILLKLPPVFPAISSAVASITAGLASNFKFREKYDIHVQALENIEIELDNFLLGTGNYKDKANKDKQDILMKNIDTIHKNRRGIWSGIITGSLTTENTTRIDIVGRNAPHLP